jgi:prepilin-type N-terminal cleavage/methylation domain-containing protein
MSVFTRLPRRSDSGFTLTEMLVTVAIFGVISAMALPMVGNAMASFRASGDARSVSNAAALTKMRAASTFSQARLYVDLTSSSFHVELWDRTNSVWTTEGGSTYLSSGSAYGFGVVATPPPSTQAAIGEAPACTNSGGAIANTACIVFNSRGLPIDGTGAPTAADAVYLTNGTAVYGITVAATGMVRMWRTQPLTAPSWVLQ